MGYFHNIIIFSPTLGSDEKWDYARSLPLLAENTELKKFIKSLESEKHDPSTVVLPSSAYDLSAPVAAPKFSPYIPASNFMVAYDEATLSRLMVSFWL